MEEIIFGVVFVLAAIYLYRRRNNPGVHFEGGGPKTVTTVLILFGLISIIIGIVGFFHPKVYEPLESFSDFTELISKAYEIFGFLLLQTMLVVALIYSVIYKSLIKRQKSEVLPLLLFFLCISISYWTWIFTTDQFYRFKEPFQQLYNLMNK